MSIQKPEIRKRLFIDIIVDNINEVKSQLDAYEKCMTEEVFNESKEVAELYAQLNNLIKETW